MSDPLTDPTRLHAPSHANAMRSAAFDSTGTGTADDDIDRPPKFHPPTHAGDLGRLGRYRVLKQLGKGGMGTVYLGIDEVLQRKVAIKVLTPRFASIPIARERFLREARTASAGNSPHVVSIIDVDEDLGNPFIAMEYLQGIPLDRYLATHPRLSLRQVLRIGQEVARGLAAAHDAGLVHRDIKPANLWLEAPHGHVKILDFGLAKETESQGRGDVTQAGQVVGTPAFMSPEQARGDVVDARTDLFCLGIVLYRLCTGEQPFTGPTAMAVLMSVGIDEPPPVREKNPKVPEALAALIHQMLRKKPAERPQSAIEVQNALIAIEEGKGAVVPEAVKAAPSASIVVAPQGDRVWEQIDITKSNGDSTTITAPTDEQQAQHRQRKAERERKQAEREVKFPWVIVGSALGGLAVVLGIVAFLMHRNNKPAEPIVEPEPVRPNPPPVTPRSDPDRKAAEWALGTTPTSFVELVGHPLPITHGGRLPTMPFKVRRIVIPHAYVVTDADLNHLRELAHLEGLQLSRTAITDVGMEKLSKFPCAPRLVELALGTEALTDAAMQHYIAFPSLRIVAFTGPNISGGGIAVLARHCPHLTHLHLNQVKITNWDMFPFGVLRWFWKLEHLGVSCPPITAFGLGNLANWHGLKSLNLWGLTDAEAAVVAKTPSLNAISLHDAAVTDAGLMKLSKIPGLKRLELTNCKGLTPGGILRFKLALPNCTVLTGAYDPKHDPERRAAEWALGKAGANISVNGGFGVMASLDRLPPGQFLLTGIDLSRTAHVLTDLDLDLLVPLASLTAMRPNRSTITDAGVKKWSEAAAAAKYSWLVVNSPNVTNAALPHLKAFASLMWLDLSGTKVTDAGLKSLADLPMLQTLDLTGTNITDEGLTTLASFENLRTLTIRKTNVTAEGVRKLWGALPHCRVVSDYVLGTSAPLDPMWVASVAKLPPAEQVKAVSAELVRRNPRFTGKLNPTIMNAGVEEIRLQTDTVSDIAPLAALPTLTRLHCTADERGIGMVVDISPLAALTQLRELSLEKNRGVSDLTPLKQHKLTTLNIGGTSVTNISVLLGMPLKSLTLNPSAIKDLSPLLKCPELLDISFDLGFVGGLVGDQIEALRDHPTLKRLDGIPIAVFWPAWDRRKDPGKLPAPQTIIPTGERVAPWIALDPASKRLATFGIGGKLQLWDAKNGEKIPWTEAKIGDWKTAGQAVEFIPGTDLIATSHYDGIRFWNLKTGKPDGANIAREMFCGFAVSPDGKIVLGHTSGGRPVPPISRYSVETRKPLPPGLEGHTGGVVQAKFSNDGRFLATVSMYPDVSVRVWDLETAKELYRQDRSWIDPVVGLAFSPDGEYLMTASTRSTIELIHIKTKKIEKSYRWFPIGGAAFAPGGKHLILNGTTGVLSVMDVATGEVLVEANSGVVAGISRPSRVIVSPDGKTIVTSHGDGNIRLYDWETLLETKP